MRKFLAILTASPFLAGCLPLPYAYPTASATPPLWVGAEQGTVRAGEETAFRIERKKGVQVRLRALGDKGEALVSANFFLVDARGNRTVAHAGAMFRPGPPKKGEEGTAAVPLFPGEYTLEARSNGFATKSLPIRVGSSSPQMVEVTLEREPKPK